MELLLNLAWLLLALPACWLWRGRRTLAQSSLQRLLSLGCLLVVLFPVVSATDDLQAMRTEMEESPAASKRTLRQSSGDRTQLSCWQPAEAPATFAFPNGFEEWHQLADSPASVLAAPSIELSVRGPPRSA